MLIAENALLAVLAHAAHALPAEHLDVVVAAQDELVAREALLAQLGQRRLAHLAPEERAVIKVVMLVIVAMEVIIAVVLVIEMVKEVIVIIEVVVLVVNLVVFK